MKYSVLDLNQRVITSLFWCENWICDFKCYSIYVTLDFLVNFSELEDFRDNFKSSIVLTDHFWTSLSTMVGFTFNK